jgi:hypothetical protein
MSMHAAPRTFELATTAPCAANSRTPGGSARLRMPRGAESSRLPQAAAGLRMPCGSARSTGDRSGVALVLFAMLVFGFMGIMAVAIDLATASLTQAQMQNAVDSGAIEGVRLRDFEQLNFESDPHRRAHVTVMVQMIFDDDLHPTGGVAGTIEPSYHGGIDPMPPDDPDQLHLGAGPIWALTPGEGAGNVGESYDDHPGVYDDPVLQANRQNLLNGDMISGTYIWGVPHTEDTSYHRDDFDAAMNDSTTSQRAIGFLVRMRRTKIVGAPDQVPDVSSGGPTLPLLFGLGSTIKPRAANPDPNNLDYDPRTDGITVRAVAIASARPAMTIGPPPDLPDRLGDPMCGVGFWYTPSDGSPRRLAPPIAVSQDFWVNQLTLHVGDKQLTESSGSLSYQGAVVGAFLAASSGGSVGMPIVTGPAPQAVPGVGNTTHYVVYFAVYRPISDGGSTLTNRVIGYGYGEIKYDATASMWTITKGLQNHDQTAPDCAMFVAPDNASARLNPDVPTLTPTEWDNVFAAYKAFGYLATDEPTYLAHMFDWQFIREGTVLAPVLVR